MTAHGAVELGERLKTAGEGDFGDGPFGFGHKGAGFLGAHPGDILHEAQAGGLVKNPAEVARTHAEATRESGKRKRVGILAADELAGAFHKLGHGCGGMDDMLCDAQHETLGGGFDDPGHGPDSGGGGKRGVGEQNLELTGLEADFFACEQMSGAVQRRAVERFSQGVTEDEVTESLASGAQGHGCLGETCVTAAGDRFLPGLFEQFMEKPGAQPAA